MIGIEGAAARVASRIEDAMGAKVAELRDRLDDPDLPDVNRVAAYDDQQLSIEQWPAVLVVPGRTGAMVLESSDGVTQDWSCTYTLRVFVWVRGPAEDRTAQIRYRLTLALREVLLGRRELDGWTVNVGTWTEAFSDVEQDAATSSTIAAAYAEFDVTGIEQLVTGRAVGRVSTATVDAGLLPPHPAL